MLMKPKQSLVMLHVCISMSIFTWLDFANCCQLLLSNTYVKNGIFETCFRRSAEGKMTAWDVQ